MNEVLLSRESAVAAVGLLVVVVAVSACWFPGAAAAPPVTDPSPLARPTGGAPDRGFEKPAPISMAELDKRYDIHWTEGGKVRREGDDATLAAIARSDGCALVMPFRERALFAVLGKASGFPPEKNQLIDHCTKGAEGGCGWGAGRWDHWPIGWLNSQTSNWKPGSAYSYSFGSIGHFFVPEGKRIRSFWKDYSEFCKDMEHNRWTERRVFYVLLGAAPDEDAVRRMGRAWLDKGADCARPESIAGLK